MQLMMLFLFIGLFAHDAAMLDGKGELTAQARAALSVPDLWRWIGVLGPKVLLAAVFQFFCWRTRTSLPSVRYRVLTGIDTIGEGCRYGLLISFAADLFYLGLLLRLRQVIGDWVVVDEVCVLLPVLAAQLWMWAAFYSVDVAVRQASLIGDLDRGRPVHRWTRGQFLLSQARHQWALMGVPLLAMFAWLESLSLLNDRVELGEGTLATLLIAGTAAIFLVTPLCMRYIWDTIPLPAGELRERLIEMCREQRIRVRELLLWRTYGRMINGAVMGVVAPLRYILLTDALLEHMPLKQVEAVMAHELAHVRKHHMFWMLIVAAGAMRLLEMTAEAAFGGLFAVAGGPAAGRLPQGFVDLARTPGAAQSCAMIVAVAGWFIVFGWVSRRFERQADTFAVQYLSRRWHEQEKESAAGGAAVEPLPTPAEMEAALLAGTATATMTPAARQDAATDATRIPAAAADAMIDTLQTVAELNHIPRRPQRWWHAISVGNWRHGSIGWRQDYLRTLVGQRIDDVAIDRLVRTVNLAGMVGIALMIGLAVFEALR